MSVTRIFTVQYTKGTVKTAPANAPTYEIFDAKAPAAALLASGNATAVTNCAGYYVVSYTGAETEVPVCNFNTADTTVTMQDLGSHPVMALDANGNVLSAVTDLTTLNATADALLDRTNGIETSFTLRQALRLVLAALAGKLSGAGTTTVTIRDVNDTANRIVATVDSDGNRSAVTKNVS